MGEMRQDVGAETDWKKRSHTRSGLVRFFQAVYAQEITSDWPSQFRFSGLDHHASNRRKVELAWKSIWAVSLDEDTAQWRPACGDGGFLVIDPGPAGSNYFAVSSRSMRRLAQMPRAKKPPSVRYIEGSGVARRLCTVAVPTLKAKITSL